jgi:hypothetical protein
MNNSERMIGTKDANHGTAWLLSEKHKTSPKLMNAAIPRLCARFTA